MLFISLVFILVRSAAITCLFTNDDGQGGLSSRCHHLRFAIDDGHKGCHHLCLTSDDGPRCLHPLRFASDDGQGAATTCVLPVMMANRLFVLPLRSAYLPACLFACVSAFCFASSAYVVLRFLLCFESS